MIDKVRTLEAAIDTVHSGDTIMVGGFTISGCPLGLLKELSRRRINNLTTISEDIGYANTASFPAEAIKELFTERHIRKVYASFIGANPFVNELIQKGELEYELIPQGTLAERIRAGGSGIAGFYTPTGIGTIAERGKEKKVIDGKEYLLELPLRADVALIKAYKADPMGNAVFKYSSMNFNPLMAMAADTVILEVEKLVDLGEINPELVQLPGIFVDQVVLWERRDADGRET
jgi:acetate CoA/acetoacetate CoA-transferase alpha subunit